MKRKATADRGGPAPFHAPEQIGNSRRRTPEGFLVCEGVPIARTGYMIYAPGEVPVPAGPGGYIMVARDAATLFDQACLLSFAGKAVTNDHPAEGVTPANWKSVAVGTVHNPRQGEGEHRDVILADLLITDRHAIDAVQSGKVEVSAGYDATYERTGDGTARQMNIIGNHVALVERGRCGPRCAIGDRQTQPPPKGKEMTTNTNAGAAGKKRVAVTPEARQLIIDAAAAIEREGEEAAAEDGVHVHVHTGDARTSDAATDQRIAKVEDTLTKMADSLKLVSDAIAAMVAAKDAEGEKKDGGKDDKDDKEKSEDEEADPEAMKDGEEGDDKKTSDSAALAASFQQVLADAEVLVPGFALPTFDAARPRKVTVDSMCQTRRRALDATCATADGRALVESIYGRSADFSKMSCDKAAVVFRAAAAAKRLSNNRSATGDGARPAAGGAAALKQMTIADLNALHRKQYNH